MNEIDRKIHQFVHNPLIAPILKARVAAIPRCRTSPCSLCGHTSYNDLCGKCYYDTLLTASLDREKAISASNPMITFSRIMTSINRYLKCKVVYNIGDTLSKHLDSVEVYDISSIVVPKGDCCAISIQGMDFIVCRVRNLLELTLMSDIDSISYGMDVNKSFPENIDSFKHKSDEGIRRMKLISAALLYILRDEDTVKQVHPGKKKTTFFLGKGDPRLYTPSTVYNVGQNYHHVIEPYEETAPKSEPKQERTGRVMPPHIRQAHEAWRRCGKGRTERRRVFIQQISVNGGTLGEQTDVTEVK